MGLTTNRNTYTHLFLESTEVYESAASPTYNGIRVRSRPDERRDLGNYKS